MVISIIIACILGDFGEGLFQTTAGARGHNISDSKHFNVKPHWHMQDIGGRGLRDLLLILALERRLI